MPNTHSPSTLLVTGAQGFLGSEICRQLAILPVRLRTLDRQPGTPVSGVEGFCADILVPESISTPVTGVDTVIHAAGLAHVFRADRAAEAALHAVNATGTFNMAQAAAEAGVRHFVLISSVAVYGKEDAARPDETSHCRPHGAYAVSKLAAEQHAIDVAQSSGMSLTILRLATLYGEEDRGNIARLMRTIDRGRFIWIGFGSNKKSLIYRGDAARACLRALSRQDNGIQVYNVSAPPVTMLEVVERIATALGQALPAWHVPAFLPVSLSHLAARLPGTREPFAAIEVTLNKWLADDVYDSTRFELAFGFSPSVSLAEGLRRQVQWYCGQTR